MCVSEVIVSSYYINSITLHLYKTLERLQSEITQISVDFSVTLKNGKSLGSVRFGKGFFCSPRMNLFH